MEGSGDRGHQKHTASTVKKPGQPFLKTSLKNYKNAYLREAVLKK